jgi:hypothetical protein
MGAGHYAVFAASERPAAGEPLACPTNVRAPKPVSCPTWRRLEHCTGLEAALPTVGVCLPCYSAYA